MDSRASFVDDVEPSPEPRSSSPGQGLCAGYYAGALAKIDAADGNAIIAFDSAGSWNPRGS